MRESLGRVPLGPLGIRERAQQDFYKMLQMGKAPSPISAPMPRTGGGDTGKGLRDLMGGFVALKKGLSDRDKAAAMQNIAKVYANQDGSLEEQMGMEPWPGPDPAGAVTAALENPLTAGLAPGYADQAAAMQAAQAKTDTATAKREKLGTLYRQFTVASNNADVPGMQEVQDALFGMGDGGGGERVQARIDQVRTENDQVEMLGTLYEVGSPEWERGRRIVGTPQWDGFYKNATKAPEALKAPNTRKYDQDGTTVTEEWDAKTGKWTAVATSKKQGLPPQMGSIPPGYNLVQRDDGSYEMKEIPGGPVEKARLEAESKTAKLALEEEEGFAKAENQKAVTARYGGVVTQDLDRIIDIVTNNPNTTTGLTGEALGWIPGTDAHDVRAMLDTVGAAITFDRMAEMRKGSAAGATGLGAINVAELNMLKASLGALKASQSRGQFLTNAKRVRNLYMEILYGEKWRDMPTGAKSGPPAGADVQKMKPVKRYNPATGALDAVE